MVSILYASHSGALRFNEFVQALEGVPPSTLAARLGELERAGIFERAVVDARPPRVEYRLTESGRRLQAIMRALGALAVSR
jgi:DNA-binding HxlR family transcriptional regulator